MLVANWRFQPKKVGPDFWEVSSRLGILTSWGIRSFKVGLWKAIWNGGSHRGDIAQVSSMGTMGILLGISGFGGKREVLGDSF